MWKKISVAAIAALAVGTMMTSPPRAGSDPVAKCLSSKQKVAGKTASGRLGCRAKAAAKSAAVDPACLAKVDGKFQSGFTKADSKGACSGSPSGVGQSIDTCITDVTNAIPGSGKCTGSKLGASGKKAGAKLGCNAKAAAKGLTVHQACIQKVEEKYRAAFAKAAGCTGDQLTGSGARACIF